MPGAYVLLLILDRAVELPARLGGVLSAGRYVYCGSARGPGGLRARVGRHLKKDKTIRWHVDRLTLAAASVRVWATLGPGECALRAALQDIAGVSVPVPGFGASDCAVCPAHLLALAPSVDVEALPDLLDKL